MSTTKPYLRYASADIHPLDDDATLVVTPTGATYRIEADALTVDALLQSFDGTAPVDEVLLNEQAPAGFDEVVELLKVEGCFIEPDHVAPPLLLIGDRSVVEPLRSLLSENAITGQITVAADLVYEIPKNVDPTTVVVAVRDRFDQSWLRSLDEATAQSGIRWTQLHLTTQGGVWGPHIEPGQTANYNDVLQRRRCAIDEPDIFDALASSPVGAVDQHDQARSSWLYGGFATDLADWLSEGPTRALSSEVEADVRELTLTTHPVLPLPSHRLDGPLRITGEGSSLLMGERTGIIQRTRRITHHPDSPARLHTVQTHNSSMARVDQEWANDVITGGSAFDDPDAAHQSALGEAVERYCGNHMGQNELCWASYDELRARGENAIDPEQLILYSEDIYTATGCPFERFTRSLRVRWVRGRSLTHDRPIWMPVTLVFVNWLAAEADGHPLTNYMNFSGVAAGPNLDYALVSGIEELVERDATMIWWMNAQPLPKVKPSAELEALYAGAPTEAGQRAWLINLDNEFDIPVMAGLVHHTVEDFFTIGFAARPDPEAAARKAWTEAWTLQEGSRDLNSPDSLIRQAITWGFASYVDLKPWRADRRYLDDYRPDFKDVTDLMCQQQVFLDKRAIDSVSHFTHVDATRELSDLPRLPDRNLDTYRERIESNGFEICYVDCTTPDVEAAGFNAVRVVIPGLVGNAPAAFPLLGRRRVQDVPVALGWRKEALAEKDLNYWPIPHA